MDLAGYRGCNYWVESGQPRELILLCAQWLDRIESWPTEWRQLFFVLSDPHASIAPK